MVRAGGSLRVDDGDNAFSFVLDPARGRARIPVNSANPMATLRSQDLPGNGSSLSKGRRTEASDRLVRRLGSGRGESPLEKHAENLRPGAMGVAETVRNFGVEVEAVALLQHEGFVAVV